MQGENTGVLKSLQNNEAHELGAGPAQISHHWNFKKSSKQMSASLRCKVALLLMASSALSPGIGMDSCVIPLRHRGLSLVQTTDFFYPSVEDPYMQVTVTEFRSTRKKIIV